MKILPFTILLSLATATVIFEPYKDASCSQKRFSTPNYSERYYVPLTDRPVGYDASLVTDLAGGVFPKEALGTWTKVTVTEVEFTSSSNVVVPFDPTDSVTCVNTGFWGYGKWKIINGPGVLELFRSDNTLGKDLDKCYNPSLFPAWHGTFRYPISPSNASCPLAGEIYIYWDGKSDGTLMYCNAQIPFSSGYDAQCKLGTPGYDVCFNSDKSNGEFESTCKCVLSQDCNTDWTGVGKPSYYPFAEPRVSTIKVIYGNSVGSTTPNNGASLAESFVLIGSFLVLGFLVF